MSSSEEQIAAEQETLEALKRDLDDRRVAFVQAAEGFAREWIQTTARRETISNAESAQALGADEIKALKQSVNELVNSAPDSIRTAFDGPRVWPDRDQPWERRSRYEEPWPIMRTAAHTLGSASPPKRAVDPLRSVFGRLGELLADKGIVQAAYGKGDWAKSTSRSAHQVSFEGYIDFSPELIEASNNYGTVLKDFLKHQEQLESAEARHTRELVETIWDEEP